MTPATPIKIFIVEDETLIAADLETQLRRLGYEVAGTAVSGEEALRKIAETQPQLVLMDVRIKGSLDGIQAAERLRESFDIPVIYLTAHTDSQTLRRARATEPFGFITKPVGRGNLAAPIEMALYKHRSELRLREREAWLSTVLRSAPDGVIVTNAAGRIEFVNPVAEELTGVSGTDAAGRSLEEVFRLRKADGKPAGGDLVRLALLHGSPMGLGGGLVLSGAGGTERYIEGEIAASEAQGVIAGAVVTFRDVTERKRQERQSIQEQKTRAVGRLAAAVSKDFHLLLNRILAHCENVLAKAPGNQDLRENIEQIRSAGSAAAEIARKLESLALSRLALPKPLDVNALITGFEDVLRQALPANVELGLALRASLGTVRADPSQFQHLLFNLVLYARDSMPDGGCIRVETENAAMSSRERGRRSQNYLRLLVRDTGPGLNAEAVEQIFEPFSESERPSRVELFSAAGIVSQLGGHIAVNSRPGEGTQFEVLLPSDADAELPALPNGENEAGLSQRHTILLVESDADIRLLVRNWFADAGFAVLEARDLEDAMAVASLHEGSLDLMVTDRTDLTGPGRARLGEIASMYPEMRLLLLSQASGPDRPAPALLRSRTEVLAKPFRRQELLERVGRMLAAAPALVN